MFGQQVSHEGTLAKRANRKRHTLLVWVFQMDWVLLGAALLLVGAGLVTMNSFVTTSNYFFEKQLIWMSIGLFLFLLLSFIDFRFLRRTGVIVTLYAISILLLVLTLLFAESTLGAQSRFNLGFFALQPVEPVKLMLVLLLAKYFSRRHIEIANIRNIFISGLYVSVPFVLVFLQPDLGSAIIIGLIWLGMVLVSGISKKHLLAVFLIAAAVSVGLWSFTLADYQKDRIKTFLHPLTDLQGAGYNAHQSTITVGSGQVLGKGVGYGTQSKLQFLPEYETDFIFAAYAEEWGFIGVLIFFILFGILIFRILVNALHGATNFEILFGVGLAIFFMSHIAVNIGMNIGLLPVTGTTAPFLSYGGSHLITEFVGLGILMGMRRYNRTAHKDDTHKEFLGV